jgi:hypothetical protein
MTLLHHFLHPAGRIDALERFRPRDAAPAHYRFVTDAPHTPKLDYCTHDDRADLLIADNADHSGCLAIGTLCTRFWIARAKTLALTHLL